MFSSPRRWMHYSHAGIARFGWLLLDTRSGRLRKRSAGLGATIDWRSPADGLLAVGPAISRGCVACRRSHVSGLSRVGLVESGMRSVRIASRSGLFAHPSRTAPDDGCAVTLRMILSEKSATVRGSWACDRHRSTSPWLRLADVMLGIKLPAQDAGDQIEAPVSRKSICYLFVVHRVPRKAAAASSVRHW